MKHVIDNLSSYVDNQLPPEEKRQVDQHLRQCTDCTQHLDSLKATQALMKSSGIPEPRAGFEDRLLARLRSEQKKRSSSRLLVGLSGGIGALAAAALLAVMLKPAKLKEMPQEIVSLPDADPVLVDKAPNTVPEIQKFRGEAGGASAELYKAQRKNDLMGPRPAAAPMAEKKTMAIAKSKAGASLEQEQSSIIRRGVAGPAQFQVLEQRTRYAQSAAHGAPAWTGSESALSKRTLKAVRTQEEWKKLWSAAFPVTPVPPVDFSQSMVVALFAGEGQANRIEIVSMTQTRPSTLVVAYRITVSHPGQSHRPYVLQVSEPAANVTFKQVTP